MVCSAASAINDQNVFVTVDLGLASVSPCTAAYAPCSLAPTGVDDLLPWLLGCAQRLALRDSYIGSPVGPVSISAVGRTRSAAVVLRSRRSIAVIATMTKPLKPRPRLLPPLCRENRCGSSSIGLFYTRNPEKCSNVQWSFTKN